MTKGGSTKEYQYVEIIKENSTLERQEVVKIIIAACTLNVHSHRCLISLPPGIGVNLHPPVRYPPKQQWQQKSTLPNNGDNDDVKNLNITKRPSSRGGMAFDINFDEKNVSKNIPKGLKNKQKTSNLMKESLQAQLDSAEQCKKVKLTCIVLKCYVSTNNRGRTI